MSGEATTEAPPEGALLRALVDHLSAMVAYWDADQRCRFANRAYERWFGVSPESLIGKHMSELLGPLYARNRPYIEGALRGQPQQFEREIPDPAGGPSRQSLADYVPHVEDGVVRGFFVLVMDISPVKRTELALRESEERFRLTIDEAPIGMALVGRDGRFLRVNRALCEIVGYGQDELTGLTFQAITHPEDLDADLALAGQLERGEIPRYQLEKRYIRKDGTLVDILLSGSAVRGPDGTTPLYYIAQIEDITERKRMEKERQLMADASALLSSSLDYEQTLTTVAQRVVRDLADWCIVDVSDDARGLRRLRVASADPAGAEVAARLERVPLDRARRYLLSPVVETRQPLLIERVTAAHLEAAAQGPEHLEILCSLGATSLLALPLVMRGRLLGVLALISSTPTRVYGAHDLRLATALADRAATALENALLYREAVEATQLRDQVLGIVAHDLRNPLGNILLQATALRQGGNGSERPADAIERAARRMNRLIQDLLDVSRTEAGRLSLQLAREPAAQVMADVVSAQAALASSASLEVHLDADADLASVWVDRDRLLQAFENLVGNAIKFTKPGGRITLGARSRDGAMVFSVGDTGAGISAADLPHVFDRFWQARRADRGGAGLGLAIVKGIVEAHGGRLWVESTPGVGSTFYFTVPHAPPP